MKKITITILFVLMALSLLAARPQPNLKKRLQETNAPTATPYPLDTPTPALYWPTVEGWQSPTPAGDLYAAREGFPVGGYGPIVVTPNVRADGWEYPFYATPCNGWIDANQVLFCVTATAIPPDYP